MTDNDTPFLFASADWRNLACSIAIMQIISQLTIELKYLQLNHLSLKMHERYMSIHILLYPFIAFDPLRLND
ncbi:hypothetical protein T4D_16854 [Trichinella pseudospiralis]|uniref:Uncharacterized protein n=1 Tax=Trichinella pseudospiralis TaxID=6337 RepID=A0A0V1G6P7_TRIPS|nr:hypothetical protein T4D_16854 [Trichinella pseudospiralis]